VFSVAAMATSSTARSSETATTTTPVSIKQEVVETDTPPAAVAGPGEAAAVAGPGEAAAVAAAAAAAAAVVQRHFRLGLASSPSTSIAGRRSALGYSSTAAAAPRSARMHSMAQPETCVCEVREYARPTKQ